jgi:hypothetical protein
LLLLSIKGGDAKVVNGTLVALPSGRMVVFPVTRKGDLGAGVVTPFSTDSHIGGPFSFVFSGPRTVIVANANTSTVAAFSINSNNQLTPLGNPVALDQILHFATCWIVRSDGYVYTASFGAPSGAREILGEGSGLPDRDGVIDGFRILGNGGVAGTAAGNPIVEVGYPPLGPERTGNHGIDMAAIDNWLHFIEPRIGMIGRLTIHRGGSLSNLVQFGGLDPSLEPYPTLNPGIDSFLTRCFLQDPDQLSPECRLGSAQGITGF